MVALPLALFVCGLVAAATRSRAARIAGLVLLVAGAGVLIRQVFRTGVGDLMPEFAVPLLVAAVPVYALAAIACARAPAEGGRRLASPGAAPGLLVAAAVIQFVGPWMLTSGN